MSNIIIMKIQTYSRHSTNSIQIAVVGLLLLTNKNISYGIQKTWKL
jgi:hypothetical protein